MMTFLEINADFAEKYNGQMSPDGVTKFFSVQTTAGKWVCDVNSLKTHPELFDGQNFKEIELKPEDFPIHETI